MNTKHATALAALTFVLAACSGETSSAPTVAATPVAVSQTSEMPSANAASEGEESSAEPSDEAQEAKSIYGERTLSERGNIVKEIGQLAAITDVESMEPLVEFKVTGIDPNFTCTADWAEPSLNGNFIAVSMEFQTTAALAKSEVPELWVSNYDFKIIGPDGTRENDSVGNAYHCLTDSETLPDTLGPGETVKGMVILDSEFTEGALIFAPDGTQSGWEWIF